MCHGRELALYHLITMIPELPVVRDWLALKMKMSLVQNPADCIVNNHLNKHHYDSDLLAMNLAKAN